MEFFTAFWFKNKRSPDKEKSIKIKLLQPRWCGIASTIHSTKLLMGGSLLNILWLIMVAIFKQSNFILSSFCPFHQWTNQTNGFFSSSWGFWLAASVLKPPLLLLSHFSRVRLCATPQKAAHQAPLSLGFSRKEHWSRLPFPSPMHACMLNRFSHVQLCDPIYGSPPGSSVHRILQARILEWVAVSFSGAMVHGVAKNWIQKSDQAQHTFRKIMYNCWEGGF